MLISTQFIRCYCDACGKADGPGEVHIPRGHEPMRAMLPAGWAEIRNRTYCPDHAITITVDGGDPITLDGLPVKEPAP